MALIYPNRGCAKHGSPPEAVCWPCSYEATARLQRPATRVLVFEDHQFGELTGVRVNAALIWLGIHVVDWPKALRPWAALGQRSGRLLTATLAGTPKALRVEHVWFPADGPGSVTFADAEHGPLKLNRPPEKAS